MKKFDWLKFRKITNPYKWQWLFDVHNTPLTEDEFIQGMKALKIFSNSKTGRLKQKAYSPSRLKKDYKRLKNKFGFFNTNTK